VLYERFFEYGTIKLTTSNQTTSARAGFLDAGPWLVREEPKSNEVQARKDSEQTPGGIVPCSAKQLCHGDEQQQEKDE
jgi:hypothetical protein